MLVGRHTNASSQIFPTAESLTLSGLEWMKKVRDWAQQQKAAE